MRPRPRPVPAAGTMLVAVALLALGVQPAAAAPTSAAAAAADLSARGPAVASPGGGRLDLFTRSVGGNLLHQVYLPGQGWSASENLGGRLSSAPAALWRGSGRLDVFARGVGGALWQRFFERGHWSAWKPLGGALGSEPVAVSWAPSRLDAFVRGTDEALWQRTHTQARGWSAWKRLGGRLMAAPAAVSWGPGRMDVFIRGGDQALRQRYVRPDVRWSAWVPLGGQLSAEPAAASWGPGRLDVLVRGSDGTLRHRSFATGRRWSAWANLGGRLATGPSVAASGGARLSVVTRWTDNRLLSRTLALGQPWTGWARADASADFRRLGAWVDLYDTALSPASAVAAMDARGVKTLYLETARFNSPTDIVDPAKVGQWIERAHAAGIKVVGWYLPGYSEWLGRDVRRTLAVAGFRSPAGQRFDAVGIDIEYRAASSSAAEFNRGVSAHLARVRAALGVGTAVGAIVPAPLGMDLNPAAWSGFPWASVGGYADVVLPMGYWTYRTDCATNARHCPYGYTVGNAGQARERSGLPVHVIGGLAGGSSSARVADFVRAARAAHADGGSLYDYQTTAASAWSRLAGLNGL
jgi:hypothetical protein